MANPEPESERFPYVYLITQVSTGRRYYGVRYGRGCHPSELGQPKGYLSSSKNIAAMIENDGLASLKFEVRRTFTDKPGLYSSTQACIWEAKVLRRMKVVGDERWINNHDTETFDHAGIARDKAASLARHIAGMDRDRKRRYDCVQLTKLRRKERRRALWMREYDALPERKAAQARYAATPEAKAAQARYDATPKGRAAQARYRATPEAKAAKARHAATPEAKAAKAAYQAAYFSSPAGRATMDRSNASRRAKRAAKSKAKAEALENMRLGAPPEID